jgi:hypothetical protein
MMHCLGPNQQSYDHWPSYQPSHHQPPKSKVVREKVVPYTPENNYRNSDPT